MEKKGTRRRPVGIIESSGSEHQRVAGGLVGFGMVRKQWKKHRSDENLTRFYKISPDLAKISLDLREITPESGFFHRILENFGRNLEIFAGILKFWLEFGNLSVSSGFRGGKQKPDPPESSSGGEDPPK